MDGATNYFGYMIGCVFWREREAYQARERPDPFLFFHCCPIHILFWARKICQLKRFFSFFPFCDLSRFVQGESSLHRPSVPHFSSSSSFSWPRKKRNRGKRREMYTEISPPTWHWAMWAFLFWVSCFPSPFCCSLGRFLGGGVTSDIDFWVGRRRGGDLEHEKGEMKAWLAFSFSAIYPGGPAAFIWAKESPKKKRNACLFCFPIGGNGRFLSSPRRPEGRKRDGGKKVRSLSNLSS